MGPSQPFSDPRETARRRAVSWRIIPATRLVVFAHLGAVGTLVEFTVVAYYNLRYGWVEFHSEFPGLNRLVITPVKRLHWQLMAWGTVAATISAYVWVKGRWRIAFLSTILCFSLMDLSNLNHRRGLNPEKQSASHEICTRFHPS